MKYKAKSIERLSNLRKKVRAEEKKECTFKPLISQKSQFIFNEYQKVFLRQKSHKISQKNQKQLKRFSSQGNIKNKKSYKKIHYDRSILKKQQKKFLQAKLKISKNEYMLAHDRNKRGSVFEHLYDQRKVQESKKIRLFQRLHQKECPFQPNGSMNAQFNKEEFFKRNEMFMKRKRKFLMKEELKLKEEFFKPNLNKRNINKPRKSLHRELYEYRDKENIKRQRLMDRYEV
jgi:hypothetical protein